MKIEKRTKIVNLTILALSGLLIGYIVYIAPYISDDCDFKANAGKSFIDVFRISAEYGNGRLLGNAMVQLLVRSKSMKTLVQTAIFLLIVSLLCINTGAEDSTGLMLALSMLFYMKERMFFQTLIWCSGFCNYVPGILCTLMAIAMIKRQKGRFGEVMLFAIGVCGQLFVEHTSIVNTLAAAGYYIYYSKYEPDVMRKRASSVWLIGTITGLAVMFLIPRIFETPMWVQQYRNDLLWLNTEDPVSFIKEIGYNLVILTDSYFSNIPLIFAVTFLLLELTQPNTVQKIALAAAPFYVLAVNLIWPDTETESLKSALLFIVWLPYILSVLPPLIKETGLTCRNEALFALILAFVSMGLYPFMTPIALRITFQGHILVIYAVLILYSSNKEKLSVGRRKLLSRVTTLFFTGIICWLSVLFIGYGKKVYERDCYVEQQMRSGETSIIIPEITQNPYIKEEQLTWSYGLTKYLEEPCDIGYIAMDYDEWKAATAAEQEK